MQTIDAPTVELRTPCCRRKVTAATFHTVATLPLDRTCPCCRKAYRVIVRPIGAVMGNGFAHQVEWRGKP